MEVDDMNRAKQIKEALEMEAELLPEEVEINTRYDEIPTTE